LAQVPDCSARVGTVEEYLNRIDQAYNILSNTFLGSTNELWFRGQVRQDFTLLPGIGRPPVNNATLEDAYLSKFESLVTKPAQDFPCSQISLILPEKSITKLPMKGISRQTHDE
jgi:hypothetical protein